MPAASHLGFYCFSEKRQSPQPGEHPFYGHSFAVMAREPHEFPEWMRLEGRQDQPADRVKVLKIPAKYADEIGKAMDATKRKDIGLIYYGIEHSGGKVIARFDNYSPKAIFEAQNDAEYGRRISVHERRLARGRLGFSEKFLAHGPRRAKGLGYFIELQCSLHLKRLGVTHLQTSRRKISDERTGQLLKAGIRVGHPVPIDEWISKLRTAVGKRLKKS